MTENFEILEGVHAMLAEIEELTAIATTISAGIVTDPEEVRDYAARSRVMLESMLIGHKLMLNETPEEAVAGVTEIFSVIYDKS
jgi:indole-3-glycerol phosphate synthase